MKNHENHEAESIEWLEERFLCSPNRRYARKITMKKLNKFVES